MTNPQPGDQASKPPLPGTIRNAFHLMLAGAVCSLIGAGLSLKPNSTMRENAFNSSPNLDHDQVTVAVNFSYAVAVVFGLICAGLWVSMAYANKAGERWARNTATGFFGLATVFLAGDLSVNSMSSAAKALDAVGWLVGLAVVILLWSKASSAYIKPQLPEQQYGAPFAGAESG